MSSDTRRAGLWTYGLGAAVIGSVGLGLLVRLPTDGDFGFSLARHGPHLWLALVVGAGFGVSGVVQTARDPRGQVHPRLLAVSTGAAFGGMNAVDLVGAGSAGFGAFAAGAAVGGLAFAALLHGASRLPGARRLATSLLLLVMLGLGLLAAVEAKGDPTGLRPVVYWLLGDLSRARWATALPLGLAIAGLTLHVLRRAGAAPVEAPDGEARRSLDSAAALLFGLCLGAAGLVSFFAWVVAVAAGWLLGAPKLRAWAALAGVLGALAMVWADVLPRALFGGLMPPLGFGVAALALPWYLLRNTGESSAPVRAVEVLLGLALAIAIGAVVFVLRKLAIFIA